MLTFYFHSLSFEFHLGSRAPQPLDVGVNNLILLVVSISFFNILLERQKQNVLLQLRLLLPMSHVIWGTPLCLQSHDICCWWAALSWRRKARALYEVLIIPTFYILQSKCHKSVLPSISEIHREKAACLKLIMGSSFHMQWTREPLSVWRMTTKVSETC